MKKIMVGVAVALALGTSTAAADGIDKRPSSIAAPVPVYAPSWSGFYIGAGIGAGAVVHDISVDDVFFDERLFNFSGADTGVLGTVIVGWDWQLGPKTVFGIFADFDFFDMSSHQRLFDGYFDHQLNHDNAWSVGARLGWLSSPSTLLYLTGGYTQVQLEHRGRFFDLDELTVSRDRNLDGWFVGAGVDTRLGASNWFLRLEYRFTQFDTGGLRIADDDEIFDMRVDTELEAHTARLTLTYKFTSGMGSGFGNWGNWGKY